MPIRRLSVQLANQIAAGEVVERPASVVKELLENAVDAGASIITLEIKAAGKLLIKVTDNGSGIPKDELNLALAPHATSKIHTVEDLDGIVTLGFRGEALASIASVSKLTLISRTKDEPHAFSVEVSGPNQESMVAPAAHPIGTSVIVRDLFFNTPARRKFLKSDKTEFNHIKDLITKIALVNFDREFKFIAEGKVVLHVPASTKANFHIRLAKLLGSEYAKDAIVFDSSDSELIRKLESLSFKIDPNYQDDSITDTSSAFSSALFRSSYPSVGSNYNQNSSENSASTETIALSNNEEGASDVTNTGMIANINKIMTMHGVILRPAAMNKALPDRLLTFLNGRCIADRTVNHALRDAYLNVVQENDASFKPSMRAVIFMECNPKDVDVNVHPRKDEVRFHDSNAIHDAIFKIVKGVLLLNGVNAQTALKGVISNLDFTEVEISATKPDATLQETSRSHSLSSLIATRHSASATQSAQGAKSELSANSAQNQQSSNLDASISGDDDFADAEDFENSSDDFVAAPASAYDNNTRARYTKAVHDFMAAHITPLQDSLTKTQEQSIPGVVCDFSAFSQDKYQNRLNEAKALVGSFLGAVRTQNHNDYDLDESLSDLVPQDNFSSTQGAAHPVRALSSFNLMPNGDDLEKFSRTEHHYDKTSDDLAHSTYGDVGYLHDNVPGAMRGAFRREFAHESSDLGLSARKDEGFYGSRLDFNAQDALAQIVPSAPSSSAHESAKANIFAHNLGSLSPNSNQNDSPFGSANGSASGILSSSAHSGSVWGSGNSSFVNQASSSMPIMGSQESKRINELYKEQLKVNNAINRKQNVMDLTLSENSKSEFLSMVIPNVILMRFEHRYFTLKGSDIYYTYIATVFNDSVLEDKVEVTNLTIPFNVAVSKEIINSLKDKDSMSCVKRCGFELVVKRERKMVEVHTIPKILRGSNLGQCLPSLLGLICASTNPILQDKRCPFEIGNQMARTKEYLVTTNDEAKILVSKIHDHEFLERLSSWGALTELKLFDLALELQQRKS